MRRAHGPRFALLLLLLLAAVAGCAAFTGKSEYADYRAVRLAGDEPTRLVAMERYTRLHPTGRWHNELQAERSAKDVPSYEAGKGTRSGLELYLKAFPEGAFVKQAEQRLIAIGAIERRRADEQARAELLAEQRRDADAERSRTWVSRFAGYWMHTLLSLDRWGEPIAATAAANPVFSRAFGQTPRPRCTADECVKYYLSRYAIPVPGSTRMERSMELILRLALRDGRLERAELLLPVWGFSRWAELEQRRVVVDADPEDRNQAVSWAVDKFLAVLGKLPGEQAKLEGYVLAPIKPPGLDATGELLDTTVDDPSAPANRIGTPEAGGQPGEPSVEQLVKPQAPDAPADMEMAPMVVGKEGEASSGSTLEMAPVTVPPAAGEEMVMAPLEVPGEGEAAGKGPGAASAPAAPTVSVAPPQVHAFRRGGLNVIVFAAGTEAAAPAYDGVIIERRAQ